MSAAIVEDYRALAGTLERERAAGRSVVLANGCFDVLHVGHVRLLADAAAAGDLLVVALNADASVRAIKGEERPLVPLTDRMEVVAALAGVDFVTSFEEPTAHALIETLRPDVLAKGTDRNAETVPEIEVLRAHGGRLLICGDVKRRSSSELVERMRETP